MKRTLAGLVSLIFIIVFISSCQKPYYDISDDVSNKNQASENTSLIEAVGEFEFTPSDDKTAAVQNDAVKKRTIFSQDGKNLYFDNSSHGLLIYDEEKGILNYACKDPLCDHKTPECPYFRNSSKIEVRDGYAYFYQRYNVFDSDNNLIQEVNRYVRVNINTNKVEILKELDGDLNYNRLISELYTDTHYYYFDVIEPKDKYENLSINLMRKNLSTEKIEVVKELGVQSYFLITYLDEKIYWYDPITQKFMYSEKEDLSEAKELFAAQDVLAPIYSNGYIIYSVHESISIRENDIWMYDMEKGTAEKLVHTTNEHYIITDKYIYYYDENQYINLEPNPKTGEDTIMEDRAIWRVERSNAKKEKIFRLSDIALNNVISNFYVVGNYIYAFYQFPNSENNDIIQSTYNSVGNILRININTKELYLIELPESLYNG